MKGLFFICPADRTFSDLGHQARYQVIDAVADTREYQNKKEDRYSQDHFEIPVAFLARR